MRLDEIKTNVAEAHEWTLEVIGDLSHLTVFLDLSAHELGALTTGKKHVIASEVSEYAERLKFLVRLFEERRGLLIEISDRISAAQDGLIPVVEAPRIGTAAE